MFAKCHPPICVIGGVRPVFVYLILCASGTIFRRSFEKKWVLALGLRLSHDRTFGQALGLWLSLDRSSCPQRFGAEGLSDAFGALHRRSSMSLALWRGGSFGCLWRFARKVFFMPSALQPGGAFRCLRRSALMVFSCPRRFGAEGLSVAFGALRGRSFSCPRRFGAEGLFVAFGALRGRSFSIEKK